MRISDVVSHANLAVYAEVALVIFFAIFLVVVVRLVLPSRGRDWDRMALLPLEDGTLPHHGATHERKDEHHA